MPRRSRRADAFLGAVALALGAAIVAAPTLARAEPSGNVDGRALIGIDQRYGGAVLADVWAGHGVVRVGGALGLGAVSKNDDATSRVLAPLALSLAVLPSRTRSGFVGIARLGAYFGAEKSGFIAGGFGSCAVGYGIDLGEGASVRFLADVWGLLGKRGGVFFGPALGLGF